MDLLDPEYFKKWFMRKKIERNPDDCKLVQGEVNKIFEDPTFVAAKNYSDIMRTCLMCCFF